MKKAKGEYLCRKCNKTFFVEIEYGSDIEFSLYGEDKSVILSNFSKYYTHECYSNHYGAADLIGCEI